MTNQSHRWLLPALLALGLILRVGVAWKQGLNAPPEPGSDALKMDTYAWNVAQGRGYRGLSPDVTDQDHLTAYRPPGTSLVWAGVYKLAGHRYDAVRLLHCVLGAATIWFVFAIGRRCFGEPVAWLAAAVWTVWPFGLLYSTQLLAEALETFWLLWYVLTVLEHLATPQGTLRDAHRILMRGASLIMTYPNSAIDPILNVLHKVGVVSDEMKSEKRKQRVPVDKLQAMLRGIGFERFIHRTFELGLSNLLVAYKPK